jgi:hypothetical protein
MSETNKIGPIIALVVVAGIFLLFVAGAMTNSGFMGSGWGDGMMGGGWMGGSASMGGGINWMWIPAIGTLALGVLLGWAIFAKK